LDSYSQNLDMTTIKHTKTMVKQQRNVKRMITYCKLQWMYKENYCHDISHWWQWTSFEIWCPLIRIVNMVTILYIHLTKWPRVNIYKFRVCKLYKFGVLRHFVHYCQVRGWKKIGEMGISWRFVLRCDLSVDFDLWLQLVLPRDKMCEKNLNIVMIVSILPIFHGCFVMTYVLKWFMCYDNL
jgi:hypothetical protein